jgi:GntR family transcriptional repressor for pyruvate dehydrogenase complex
MTLPVPQREIWKTSEKVAFRLAHDIVSGGLVEGDHLPREAELVGHYAVSRESIREALRLLEAQGMVSIRRGPGGGPIVGRAESSNLGRTMTLYFHLSGSTYDELLHAWFDLEPGVAGRAAANPDRDQVARLMTPHLDRFEDGGDRACYMTHSNGLHFALSALDPNRVLRMLVAAVGDIIRTHVILAVDPFDIRELIDDDHRAIAQAVLAADVDAASAAMRRHIEQLDPIYRAHWDGSLFDLVTWK